MKKDLIPLVIVVDVAVVIVINVEVVAVDAALMELFETQKQRTGNWNQSSIAVVAVVAIVAVVVVAVVAVVAVVVMVVVVAVVEVVAVVVVDVVAVVVVGAVALLPLELGSLSTVTQKTCRTKVRCSHSVRSWVQVTACCRRKRNRIGSPTVVDAVAAVVVAPPHSPVSSWAC
jgi:hypothetical protein